MGKRRLLIAAKKTKKWPAKYIRKNILQKKSLMITKHTIKEDKYYKIIMHMPYINYKI